MSTTHLSVKLPCCQDDMLTGLLLERLNARVRLAEESESSNELGHVRRVLRL